MTDEEWAALEPLVKKLAGARERFTAWGAVNVPHDDPRRAQEVALGYERAYAEVRAAQRDYDAALAKVER